MLCILVVEILKTVSQFNLFLASILFGSGSVSLLAHRVLRLHPWLAWQRYKRTMFIELK